MTAEKNPLRKNPHLYQANARILLARLSGKYGKKLSLLAVPDREWDSIREKGFDFLWLMGVWQRSPAAKKVALSIPELREAFDRTLPGWSAKDVAGSPYAVYSYRLDSCLGKPGDLGLLRKKLNRLGLRLMLDFVPNHLAMDHAWTLRHPEWFVGAGRKQALAYPELFFRTAKGRFLAQGKDPYFPPWRDTVQVNFFSPEMREALTRELVKISEVSDGLRCDMSMLALNEIFRKVWAGFLGDAPEPKEEFWARAIPAVRKKNPRFVFMAEVYWGLEARLLELGFDFAYDKILYDRLLDQKADGVRACILPDKATTGRLAHFIENHDEKRAATAFGAERSLAAAAVIGTIPGLRFFHDGQPEGRHLHLPIQLVREPREIPDERIGKFYAGLLAFCDARSLHRGDWLPLDMAPARSGDESFRNFLCWRWTDGRELKIVIINYSALAAGGRLDFPLSLIRKASPVFFDEISGRKLTFEVTGQTTCQRVFDLSPWGVCLLSSA